MRRYPNIAPRSLSTHITPKLAQALNKISTKVVSRGETKQSTATQSPDKPIDIKENKEIRESKEIRDSKSNN